MKYALLMSVSIVLGSICGAREAEPAEESIVEVTHLIRREKNQAVTIDTRIQVPAVQPSQTPHAVQQEDPDFDVTSLLHEDMRVKKETPVRISKVEEKPECLVVTIQTDGKDGRYDINQSAIISSINGEFQLVLGKKHDKENV